MIQGTEKNTRLNIRVNKDLKHTIEQAAARLGQSISEFALSTLSDRARDVLNEDARTQLSERDREVFLKLLDEPLPPNEALRDAAEAYRQQRGTE